MFSCFLFSNQLSEYSAAVPVTSFTRGAAAEGALGVFSLSPSLLFSQSGLEGTGECDQSFRRRRPWCDCVVALRRGDTELSCDEVCAHK